MRHWVALVRQAREKELVLFTAPDEFSIKQELMPFLVKQLKQYHKDGWIKDRIIIRKDLSNVKIWEMKGNVAT